MSKVYKILELIGPECLTFEDGQKIYEEIQQEVLSSQPVRLDFADVKVFASPFFNAAIGQLLKGIELKKLRELLDIQNLIPAGRNVLDRVLENSERYYRDPEYRKALDEILKEHEEE